MKHRSAPWGVSDVFQHLTFHASLSLSLGSRLLAIYRAMINRAFLEKGRGRRFPGPSQFFSATEPAHVSGKVFLAM